MFLYLFIVKQKKIYKAKESKITDILLKSLKREGEIWSTSSLTEKQRSNPSEAGESVPWFTAILTIDSLSEALVQHGTWILSGKSLVHVSTYHAILNIAPDRKTSPRASRCVWSRPKISLSWVISVFHLWHLDTIFCCCFFILFKLFYLVLVIEISLKCWDKIL